MHIKISLITQTHACQFLDVFPGCDPCHYRTLLIQPGTFHQDTGQYSLFGSSGSGGPGSAAVSNNTAASTVIAAVAIGGKKIWTAREEVRLLDAIEQYGYGNWEDISRHIETKTAEGEGVLQLN